MDDSASNNRLNRRHAEFSDYFDSNDMFGPSLKRRQIPHSVRTLTPLKHSAYSSLINQSNSVASLLSSTGGLFSPGRPASETQSKKALFGSTLMSTNFQNQTLDVTSADSSIFAADDAKLSECRNIFADFADSLNLGQQEIFGPVQKYENICRETIAPLRNICNTAITSQGRLCRTYGLITVLEREMDTWNLVSSLYKDRYATERQFEEEPMLLDCYQPSEKKLTDALFEQNQTLRQAQLIVDWLENIAERYLEDYYNKAEFSLDHKGSWENTLHQLQTQRAGIQTGKIQNIVTELDPDAPLRQGKCLADLDKDDDDVLLKYVFFCIRAGRLDEAHKVCSKVGQLWRAASLVGWQLYHDPNMEQLGPGGKVQAVEGNPFRDLWKRTCWKVAEDERLSVYERGIYAVLSGNLNYILPCCSSWSDYVWAYFRVLVDQTVESNIHQSFVGSRPLLDLPDAYTNKRLTFDSIFKEIAAGTDEKISREAAYRFNMIQKYVILGDIEGLIEAMHAWCKEKSDHTHPHLIRFMAHLVLFFRSLDVVGAWEDSCDDILVEYIKLLIQNEHVQLVAIYTAKVPKDHQIDLYSKFLEEISGSELRRRCLELAEAAGLDVPLITKLVVENIRTARPDTFVTDADLQLEAVTSEGDEVKIEAIEWLTFDPKQRSEALQQANAVMRGFLGARKLAACQKAFDAVPLDSVDSILTLWQKKTGSSNLPLRDERAVREYFCIKAYLEAQISFSRWFEHLHHAKPLRPELGIGGDFTERVAIEHRLQEYEADLEKWQQSLMNQTEATKKSIYNVLLFVDGGWLIDQEAKEEIDENRARELSLLRHICLPALCFLLHKVLHTTEQYRECVQFADVIVSEAYHLYNVFQPEELQKLLQLIRDSAVMLLDNGFDPLGYPLS